MWSAEAALAVALVGYLDPFFPSVVRAPASAAALAIGLVWLLTALNVIGIRTAGRVQVVTTVLKIIPLVVVGIGGLFAIDPSHFAIAATGANSFVRTVSTRATLMLWAFLGLECATIPAQSIAAPERTIPRATVAGTILTAAVSIISTVGIMGMLHLPPWAQPFPASER